MTPHALLTALVNTHPEHQPHSRSGRTLVLVIIWLAAEYATAILTMWLAWDTLSWWLFWIITGFMLLTLPLTFLTMAGRNRSRFAMLSRSQLRDILAHANDQLAPPISIQPVPTPLSSEDVHLGPFISSSMPTMTARSTIFAFVALFLPLSAVIIPPLLLFVFPVPSTLLLTIMVAAFCLLLVNMTLLVIWAIRSSSQRLAVTASSSGIAWHLGARGEAQHMDWSQARALLRVKAASSSSSSSLMTNYVLIGADAVLIWSLPTKSHTQIFHDSERLLGAIVARTQLPLRDATKFVGTLSGAGKSTQRLLDYYGLTPHLAAEPLLNPPDLPSSPARAGRIIGIMAAVIVATLPLAAGGWAQSYSSSYFDMFPQHIAAERPFYSSSLNHADGLWPDSSDSGYFAGALYEMHNSANIQQQIAMLSGYSFGNAAYSVTATESGAVPNDAEDGIGLAFHISADATEYVAFIVKYDGEWELRHYSPHLSDGEEYLDGGVNNGILEGPGATNTLTIVTYSHSALLFVNGHFIKQYIPQSFDHVDLSQTGAVGVYLNSAAMTGDFSGFAVSPAPPADFWEVLSASPPWHA